MPYSEKQLAASRAIETRGEPLAVELVTYENKRAPGTLRLERLSDEQRASRGRKWLLAFCGLSFACAVVPPHVPWFLLAIAIGVGGYFVRRRQREVILGGTAHCPACGALQIVDAQSGAELPFLHFCSECQTRCTVEPTAGTV